MTTTINRYWQIILANMPQGKWLQITDIYNIVESNFNDFTDDDKKQVTGYNKEPTWHRDVRNALQIHKSKGEILYDENARYKFPLYSNNTISPERIIWIKNVKRNKGTGWAYESVTCSEPFYLHWPTSRKGSATTPKIGDIIVLFQKPNSIKGLKNYNVHLTHLVTPISEDLLIDNKSPNHKWCRLVQLIAKPDPIEQIPNPGYFKFSIPNSGLTNPIKNLHNSKDLSEEATQDTIWDLFQNFFCFDIEDNVQNIEDTIGTFGEIEGIKKIKEHIQQEYKTRNSSLVQKKKALALKHGNGKILCECCKFDFLKTFGNHGTGFIECHHKIHLSKGERLTNIEDLSLVCSNCHRMLHRKNLTNSYYSVEQLEELVMRQKSTNT